MAARNIEYVVPSGRDNSSNQTIALVVLYLAFTHYLRIISIYLRAIENIS